MILHNQDLVNELSAAFKVANRRIWIAVPFIGSWKSVERITGNNWMTQKNIDFHLITDIGNANLISADTFNTFKKYAEIKTLEGLHAKLYIIDDFILLTSANLTEAAFSKRYEVGITVKEEKKIVKIFEEWWAKADKVDISWSPTKTDKLTTQEPEETKTNHLRKLWDLPKVSRQKSAFTEYAIIVTEYNKFVKLYEKHVKRLIPKLTVYQEIDGFFNYLFHEHPQKPSYPFMEKQSYRMLTDNERIMELKAYAKQYKKWLTNNPTFEDYRIKSIRLINKHLSKSHINNLTDSDIRDVVNCLHCMNSFDLNKYRFTNPINNKTAVIKEAWRNLLHNNLVGLNERMAECKSKLRFFGKSAIRELIGWYFPDKYPIINRNSNSGMKFFGYDIKTY